jgi:hypothetical protein
MMKKVWLILLAVALVFGFVATSCGGSSSSDDDDEDSEDFTTDLCQNGPLVIKLKGNFEYGKGYQENFMDKALFNGNKVNEGDEFTLEISFKGDRDLTAAEDFLAWGLVDTVTNYWDPLSWTEEDEYKLADVKDLTSGDKTTDLKIKFTALKSSPDNAPAKNALNIQFDSPEDKAASGNSGTYNPNPLTLTFTKFKFSRGEGGTPPPPPETPDIPDGAVLMPEGALNKGGTAPNLDADGEETQFKWVLKDDDFDNFMSAKYLVIETENEISGGIQLIWQDLPSYANWAQEDILEDSGAEKTGMTTVSADKKTLTIELAGALKDYQSKLVSGIEAEPPTITGIQLFLGYYTGPNKMAGLGIKSAYLLLK